MLSDVEHVKVRCESELQENDIEKAECNETTALTRFFIAVGIGDHDILESLIAGKIDVNGVNDQGMTPLHAGVRAGHADVVELLIRKNADIGTPDRDGFTCIQIAARYSYLDVAVVLLSNGANFKTPFPGCHTQEKTRLEIPAIDISAFVHPDQFENSVRREKAKCWDQMLCKYGLAMIHGHGVSDTLLREVRKNAKAFFGRSEHYKNRYGKMSQVLRGANGPLEGHAPVSNEMVGNRLTDPVEGYTFISSCSKTWDRPEAHPKELIDVMPRYYYEVTRVMHTLHKISALALCLEDTFFDEYYVTPANVMVLSHYPPIDGEHVQAGRLRYRAHSDYTGFTIVNQDEGDHDDEAGLEVDVGGVWHPVKAPKGCFLIHVGDVLETWTNGRWPSVPHRVTSPSLLSEAASKSRMSIMLFTGPSMDSTISPIPTCVDEQHPALFDATKASDHLLAQYLTKSKEANYAPQRKIQRPS